MVHILAWTVFGLAVFFYRPLTSDFNISYQYWIRQSVAFGLLMATYYFNSLVLVPRLLMKGHPVYYLVIIAFIVLVFAFSRQRLDRVLNLKKIISYVHQRLPGIQAGERLSRPGLPPLRAPSNIVGLVDTFSLTIVILILGIGTTTTAIQTWRKDNEKRKELEKEKVTSELSFLKAQINPHFFFNTLNNIYVLTAIDPKVAGEATLQLSKMMRYLLYDTQHGHTVVSQEIAFVKNYVSLMKLRLTEVVKISMATPSTLQDLPLAPMIFMPFVENAFKHGVSATDPSYIDILVTQEDALLYLTVTNSVKKDHSISLDANSGIGLENTRRRLDLLYPGKYKLEIKKPDNAKEYIINLTLDLS